MKRLIPCWMVVVLVAIMSSPALGQDLPKTPAVNVSAPNLVLDFEAGDDVCAIDFRNVRMFGANANLSAKLKDGKYERQGYSKYESVKVNDVFCFKQEGGGGHALVITTWASCGDGCTKVGIVQVFEARASQPVITQQFVFGAHAEGTHATFDEKSLTLTITGRSDDGSPTCCVRNLDVVAYRWQETEFKQASYERVPAPGLRILAMVEYDNFDPSSGHSTCLVVFRDGRFQMGQNIIAPTAGIPKFVEDSLPDESLNTLHTILEAQELKDLGTVHTAPVGIRQGESIFAHIYRSQTEQTIQYAAVQAPAGPGPKVFPTPLLPLVQWIQATSKAINQRKLSPIKNIKSSGDCWRK